MLKYSQMKITLIAAFLISTVAFGQDVKAKTERQIKGSFYAYWGWNVSNYTKSDINFSGTDYNFTIYDAVAIDRQSQFDPKIYFNPGQVTIPQYNLRIGYFLNEKFEFSFGVDHMKYVMRSYQTANISGTIQNSGTAYDGTYDNTATVIKPELLLFEHTDGLNYLNLEARRSDKLLAYKKFALHVNEGIGAGCLLPKTNTKLLNNARYDQFHFAGFGIAAVAALKFEFYTRFYIQSEIKLGYINMPDIRTTINKEDRAKQHFSFIQSNVVFGVNFNTKKRK